MSDEVTLLKRRGLAVRHVEYGGFASFYPLTFILSRRERYHLLVYRNWRCEPQPALRLSKSERFKLTHHPAVRLPSGRARRRR